MARDESELSISDCDEFKDGEVKNVSYVNGLGRSAVYIAA